MMCRKNSLKNLRNFLIEIRKRTQKTKKKAKSRGGVRGFSLGGILVLITLSLSLSYNASSIKYGLCYEEFEKNWENYEPNIKKPSNVFKPSFEWWCGKIINYRTQDENAKRDTSNNLTI